MARGGEGSTSGKNKREGVLIWQTALKAHLGVEGHALVALPVTRIGLNELVIEKDSWLWNKVEQLSGIGKVWDVKDPNNQCFDVVYATS